MAIISKVLHVKFMTSIMRRASSYFRSQSSQSNSPSLALPRAVDTMNQKQSMPDLCHRERRKKCSNIEMKELLTDFNQNYKETTKSMQETYQTVASRILTTKDKTPDELFYECCPKEANEMLPSWRTFL